jgi:hypothetical protein
MPHYIIERQYLVPVYEHVIVEARDFETACRDAFDEIKLPWGDDTKTDYESSRPTTIERAVEVPNWTQLGADEFSLPYLLYDAGFDPLPVPREFIDESGDPPIFGGFV